MSDTIKEKRSLPPFDSDAEKSEDRSSGLQWPSTWRGVYLVVLGSFLLWVGLLYALSVTFG